MCVEGGAEIIMHFAEGKTSSETGLQFVASEQPHPSMPGFISNNLNKSGYH